MSLVKGSKRSATEGNRASTPSRRVARQGVLALGASLAILLALPLVSFGSGNPVTGAVGNVLKVVPKVTGTLQSTVQKIVHPAAPAPAPTSSSGSTSSASATSHTTSSAPRAGGS